MSNADQAVAAGNDLAAIKQSVNEVMHALLPEIAPSGTAGLGFGPLPAVQETISHMEFAAESDDATQNVRDSVPRIVQRWRAIIGKCNEVEVLGSAVTASRSARSGTRVQGDPEAGRRDRRCRLGQLRCPRVSAS